METVKTSVNEIIRDLNHKTIEYSNNRIISRVKYLATQCEA